MITTKNEVLNIDFKFFQRHSDYIVNYCIKYDIDSSEFVRFTPNQKKMLKKYIATAINKLGPIKSVHSVWVSVPVLIKVYNIEEKAEIAKEALNKCAKDFDPSLFPEGIDFQIMKINVHE